MRKNLLKKFFKNMSERMGKIFDFGRRKGEAKKNGGENGAPEKEGGGPKVVEIVRFAEPEPIVLVRCVLENGVVRLEASPDPNVKSENIIADLNNGVPSLTEPEKKLYPKDGESFFQALLIHYRTVYLGAREEVSKNK
jgi:hypothetical protein